MQLGVRNDAAARAAEAAGVKVVMDRCPKIEFARLVRRDRLGRREFPYLSSRRARGQSGFQRLGLRPGCRELRLSAIAPDLYKDDRRGGR